MVPVRPASTPIEVAGCPVSEQRPDNVNAEQVCSCAPDGVAACAHVDTCQMLCRQCKVFPAVCLFLCSEDRHQLQW